MQIQLFIPVIIDEIRFDPDDIIIIEDKLGKELILHEAAQNINEGILSTEEIKAKEPNYVELQSIVKLPGDIDISPLIK